MALFCRKVLWAKSILVSLKLSTTLVLALSCTTGHSLAPDFSLRDEKVEGPKAEGAEAGVNARQSGSTPSNSQRLQSLLDPAWLQKEGLPRFSSAEWALLAPVEAAFLRQDLARARLYFAWALAARGVDGIGELPGPWHLWQELLDWASCKPLSAIQRKSHVPRNRWELLLGLVRLERMRWERAAAAASRGAEWPNPLSKRLWEGLDGRFEEGIEAGVEESFGEGSQRFFRNPAELSGSVFSEFPDLHPHVIARLALPPAPLLDGKDWGEIRDSEFIVSWPESTEFWPDEFPLPMENDTQCRKLAMFEELASQQSEGVGGWLNEELSLAAKLVEAVNREHPLYFSLLLLQASNFLQLGGVEAALSSISEALSSSGERQLSFARAEERDALFLLLALGWEKEGEVERAVEAFQRLQSSPHLEKSRGFIASRLLFQLARNARWEQVLSELENEEIWQADTAMWLSWLQAKALSELGRDAELFAFAREKLHALAEGQRRPEERLLADLVYARLAESTFGSRVVELVESIGQPREIFLRLERLSQVAFEGGHHQFSREVLVWLLNNHQAAAVRPRYHGLLAAVAFEMREQRQFKSHLRQLSRAPDELLRAIAPSRRRQFFQERDEELLSLVSYLLPRLPDDRSLSWGVALADEVGHFVRHSEQSRVHGQIVELYRSLRVLLEDDRAWAERVGSSSPPLVLGEWVVERPDFWPPLPSAPIWLGEPDCLLHIPWLSDGRRACFGLDSGSDGGFVGDDEAADFGAEELRFSGEGTSRQ